MRTLDHLTSFAWLFSPLMLLSAAVSDGATVYSSRAEMDRVTSLPGLGEINGFEMFSGYISVSTSKERKLFYILTTAEIDPETAPVILWLNGGPGCSSVGGGFLTELGPWYPTQGGDLVRNSFAWNKFANVIYVEAPAFVGFSYSRDINDGDVGDKGTAEDNLKFLLGFFERFPSLRGNSLWISGESYAGHYVPQLALEIVSNNDCARHLQGGGAPETAAVSSAGGGPLDCSLSSTPLSAGERSEARAIPSEINLVGLTLGNAWTDAKLDNQGNVDHWWTHSMISDETRDALMKYCDFGKSNPLDPHPNPRDPETNTELCDHFCNIADKEIGDIDIYDTITDDCHDSRARGEIVTLGRRLSRAGSRAGIGARFAAHRGTQAAVNRILELRSHASLSSDLAINASASAPTSRRHLDTRLQIGGRPRRGDSRSVFRRPSSHGEYKEREDVQQTAAAAADPREAGSAGDDPKYDPCVEDYAETYLNRADVQLALHANQSSDIVDWRWVFCNHNNPLRYQELDLQDSMLPLYDQLLSLRSSLRILLYSGDADASVPALGTRYWLSVLGLRQQRGSDWRTWSSSTGQVGGYLALYKELTFATVRAAGHMVPYTQPERAHFLISNFIEGRDLPR